MVKALVVGDIHLKPQVFDKVRTVMMRPDIDMAVFLGDLVDDWGKIQSLALYTETLEKAIEFHNDYKSTLWGMGNHDFGYKYPDYGPDEFGHSLFASMSCKDTFKKFFDTTRPKIMHIVDNVVFSHAGVCDSWVKRHGDKSLEDLASDKVSGPEIYWEEDSPIWTRPQGHVDERPLWKEDKYLHVVGHTPVETITQEKSLLSCDTLSTYQDGTPIGDGSMAIVDTVKKTYEKVR